MDDVTCGTKVACSQRGRCHELECGYSMNMRVQPQEHPVTLSLSTVPLFAVVHGEYGNLALCNDVIIHMYSRFYYMFMYMYVLRATVVTGTYIHVK